MATPGAPEESDYLPNVLTNAQSITYVKSTTSSLSGAFCGLLGLTNLSGFFLYVITSLLISTAYAVVNCSSKPGVYFKGGWREVILGGLLENLFAFVLFWTLFYAIVHIYN